jgi:cellulose synthase operon protein C
MDTLGWILANTGQAAKGLASLQKAHSKAPDNAEIHWHLAYALHASGDTKRTRQELETLLGRGIPFAAEAEARKLQRQLNATR